MTRQLDTSGFVEVPVKTPSAAAPYTHTRQHARPTRWSALDPFMQGYVGGASVSTGPIVKCRSYGCNGRGYVSENNRSDNPCKGCGTTGKQPFAFSDLAPETLARIVEDCATRMAERPRLGSEKDGEHFWRARQRGTWEATFPPLTVYLGDDGKVYLREAS